MKAYFIPTTDFVEVQTSLVCASTDGSGQQGNPDKTGDANSIPIRRI